MLRALSPPYRGAAVPLKPRITAHRSERLAARPPPGLPPGAQPLLPPTLPVLSRSLRALPPPHRGASVPLRPHIRAHRSERPAAKPPPGPWPRAQPLLPPVLSRPLRALLPPHRGAPAALRLHTKQPLTELPVPTSPPGLRQWAVRVPLPVLLRVLPVRQHTHLQAAARQPLLGQP